MGRPKRERGGGRVTSKTTFPRGLPIYRYFDDEYQYDVELVLPEEESETDHTLGLWTEEAADVAATCTDMDEADAWASFIQCGIASKWSPDGIKASRVLSHAEHEGGPAGAALAAAVAVYGPPEARGRARRVLRRLSENGHEVPTWTETLGEAAPVRAVRLTDQWHEHSTVIVDYARPDGTVHGLSVAMEAFCKGMANRFSIGASSTALDASDGPGGATEDLNLAREPGRATEDLNLAREPGRATEDLSLARDPGRATEDLSLARDPGRATEDLSLARDPGRATEDLSLADARAIIEAGLRVYDETMPAVDDLDEPALSDDLRALVEQRIGLLPDGGRAPANPVPDTQEIARLIAEFVSLPIILGAHADELTDMVTTMIGFCTMCHDRDILRWTPPRVVMFLEQWIPEHGLFCGECGGFHEHPPDEEWLATVEVAFPQWLRFAARRSGLATDVLDANLAAARESLRQMRRRAGRSLVRFG